MHREYRKNKETQYKTIRVQPVILCASRISTRLCLALRMISALSEGGMGLVFIYLITL